MSHCHYMQVHSHALHTILRMLCALIDTTSPYIFLLLKVNTMNIKSDFSFRLGSPFHHISKPYLNTSSQGVSARCNISNSQNFKDFTYTALHLSLVILPFLPLRSHILFSLQSLQCNLGLHNTIFQNSKVENIKKGQILN